MVRKLHFGLFVYPGGHHLAGWRHPSVAPKEILGFEYYRRAALAAERGLFDLYFVGDMLAAREREGWSLKALSTTSTRSQLTRPLLARRNTSVW
jgi:alkanesulfonate monooxygenase SsuD/methylene tetrahydromethanopterin reductase-like flavin-dependent oxidoreductase (luciferase family)